MSTTKKKSEKSLAEVLTTSPASEVSITDRALGIERDANGRFIPGQSGNPRGGGNPAGMTLSWWYSVMADWPMARLTRAAAGNEPGATAAYIAAAKQWLQALCDDCTAAGKPIRGESVDRIHDRTIGRPKQAVDVEIDVATQRVEDLIDRQLPHPNDVLLDPPDG